MRIINPIYLLGLVLFSGSTYSIINPVDDQLVFQDCGGGLANADGCATSTPKIAFTDFINGPDTGLGDGFGSGTIVTIWGHNLGDSQGSSTIQYCDSGATCRDGYVYYWKRADGTLPGGPADLYTSHRMQEIGFSIPDSDLGAGTIEITVGDTTVTTPFTVRAGNIYHVKNDGNNSTGDGSFATPWATVSQDSSGAFQKISPGDIVYSHGVIEESTTGRAIYMSGKEATLSAQTGLSAYPGTRPQAIAKASATASNPAGAVNARAFDFFVSKAVVLSKYTSLDGSYIEPDPSSTDILVGGGRSRGILTTANGRVVGNFVSDPEGHCPSGVDGAIVGAASNGYDNVGNAKVFGNHIKDYGCNQTSHFHHTTYFTNRSGVDLTVQAWEMAYNHLQNNQAKYGLHNYDQALGGGCSDVSGEIYIHRNVIYNQKGAGITFLGGESDTATDGDPGVCWTTDFRAEYNLLKNVGLGPGDERVVNSSAFSFQDGGMTGTATIKNNIIYTYSDDFTEGEEGAFHIIDSNKTVLSYVIQNNIIYSNRDVLSETFSLYYTAPQLASLVTASNNYWYYDGVSPSRWVVPTWDASPITVNPSILFNGVVVISDGFNVEAEAGSGAADLYGTTRATSFIGSGIE